jgi:hypothetical protein
MPLARPSPSELPCLLLKHTAEIGPSVLGLELASDIDALGCPCDADARPALGLVRSGVNEIVPGLSELVLPIERLEQQVIRGFLLVQQGDSDAGTPLSRVGFGLEFLNKGLLLLLQKLLPLAAQVLLNLQPPIGPLFFR